VNLIHGYWDPMFVTFYILLNLRIESFTMLQLNNKLVKSLTNNYLIFKISFSTIKYHLKYLKRSFMFLQKKFFFQEKYFLKISACLKYYVFLQMCYSTTLCSTLLTQNRKQPVLESIQGCHNINVVWWSNHHLNQLVVDLKGSWGISVLGIWCIRSFICFKII
jgi:hypothetical protein